MAPNYRHLRDQVTTADMGMRDDAVAPGQEGFNNAALLTEALDYCSRLRIPFHIVPCGHRGRFYIGSQVNLPRYVRLVGKGGRLLTFGQTHTAFRSTAGADIEISDLEVEGDLKGGNAVREGYPLGQFIDASRCVIRRTKVNRFNGGMGWVVQGVNVVADLIDVSENTLVGTATDSGIYIIQAAKLIRCNKNRVTGNPGRTLAMGGVDDRIIVAYHDVGGHHPARRSDTGIITGNVAEFSHAHGIAVGAFRNAMVTGNTAYCSAWGIELLSSQGFKIPPCTEATLSGNLVIGGRVQTPGTQTAAYKVTGATMVKGTGNRSLVTPASLREQEAARPLYGALLVGAASVNLDNLTLSGCEATALVSQAKDVRISNLTAEDCGQGAVMVSDPLSRGHFRLDGARFTDLFRDPGATNRVVSIEADAKGLSSVELANITYNRGRYNRRATMLFNGSGVLARTRSNVHDGVAQPDTR
jgi:hypothetical protein